MEKAFPVGAVFGKGRCPKVIEDGRAVVLGPEAGERKGGKEEEEEGKEVEGVMTVEEEDEAAEGGEVVLLADPKEVEEVVEANGGGVAPLEVSERESVLEEEGDEEIVVTLAVLVDS